ncbi:DUF4873 domain-containing protein [Nocardia altamirensis]|uniref:DUF4873 domain-containing protein n=1 Tax=Nocardia altamirensis TaxID=472158 RepID=UPI00084062C1|nr:DUF4873 domain-containing protein [Nocardia altamirensis]
MSDPADDHDYQGQAVITVDGTEIPVELTLRGHFQGIDGIYRWYGRIQPNLELAAAVGDAAIAEVTTSFGSAPAAIGELDFWGRYRVSGHSTPPFFVPNSLAEIEDARSAQ